MKHKNGYILLSSVLVLSAVFMLLALGVSRGSLYTSEGVLLIRYGAAAQHAAKACAEYALMELTRDLAYSGNETRMVGESDCEILPVSIDEDGSTTLRTQSTVSGHTQRVIVEVSAVVPDVTITSYRAVDDF